MLGTMRTGPDLADVGSRLDAGWHLLHFFDPTITSKGSNMAPFSFLYKKVELKDGEPVPARAIKLPDDYRKEKGIAANVHSVPTERVDNLIAYMMRLKIEGSLPESPVK